MKTGGGPSQTLEEHDPADDVLINVTDIEVATIDSDSLLESSEDESKHLDPGSASSASMTWVQSIQPITFGSAAIE